MTISATTQGLRMGVATSSSRPAVPFDGQVISETDTDSLKVYNGTAWVGSNGMTLLSTTTLSGSTTAITGIDQNYINLFITVEKFYASSNAYLRLYVNGDSTAANYVSGGIRCATGLAAAVVDGQYEINGYSEKNAANNSLYTVTIPSYANTIIKTLNCSGNQFQANSSTVASYSHTIVYNSTTAISSITFAPSAGTMSAGTVRIYGVR